MADEQSTRGSRKCDQPYVKGKYSKKIKLIIKQARDDQAIDSYLGSTEIQDLLSYVVSRQRSLTTVNDIHDAGTSPSKSSGKPRHCQLGDNEVYRKKNNIKLLESKVWELEGDLKVIHTQFIPCLSKSRPSSPSKEIVSASQSQSEMQNFCTGGFLPHDGIPIDGSLTADYAQKGRTDYSEWLTCQLM